MVLELKRLTEDLNRREGSDHFLEENVNFLSAQMFIKNRRGEKPAKRIDKEIRDFFPFQLVLKDQQLRGNGNR
jgi:hypothetical protein